MAVGLDKSVVLEGETLHDALSSLEASSTQVVIVVDHSERVVGLATDGDVRRALLGGATLSDPIARFMKRDFVAVSELEDRAHVLDLMQARQIDVVPILGEGHRLVGLHRLQDIVRRAQRRNWAVVMAGGRGTRLAPITKHVTKPMIRVAGRPILERIVLHLVGSGVETIFLATNYLAEQVESHFGDGRAMGCEIRYLREERPMGTGGALSLLPDNPRDPILVMNGDLLTEADVGGMLDAHSETAAVASVAIRRYFHNVPFGCVALNGDRVEELVEKPTLTRFINAGIYVLSPELVARVPKNEFPLPRLIEEAIGRGEYVRAHEVHEDWIDVGQRDQLRLARGEDV